MTIHNLSFYLDTLRKLRQSIRLGRFEEFRAGDAAPSSADRTGERDAQDSPTLRAREPGKAHTLSRDLHGRSSHRCSPSRAPPGRASRTAFASLILMGLIFGIFYFVLILPMKTQAEEARGAGEGPEDRRQGHHQPRHLRDHRGRRGRCLPRPRRRQDQDQGAEERRGRPAGARAPKRRRSRCLPPCRTRSSSGSCSPRPWPASCYFAVRQELRLRATLYGSFLLACVVAVWPPYEHDGQPGKIHLGLDLQGRDPPRPAGGDRRRARTRPSTTRCRPRATRPRRKGITFGAAQRVDTPTSFSVDGRGAGARQGHARPAARLLPRRTGTCSEPGEGSFLVKMTDAYRAPDARPHGEGGDPHPGAPRQPARAWPSRSSPQHGAQRRPDPGPAARASPTSSRPSASSRRTAQLAAQARRGHGRQPESLLAEARAARCPTTWTSCRARARRPGAARLLPRAQGGGHHRPRPEERARRRRTRTTQPDVQFTLNAAGRGQVQARDRPQRRPAAGHHPRRHGRLRARSSSPRSAPRARSRAASPRRRRTSSPRSCAPARCPPPCKYLQELTVGASLGQATRSARA